jgi:polysaccharide pyruvyl transferase WcaK-like protein
MNDRRTFLAKAASLAACIAGFASIARTQNAQPRKTILLRSSWQTVNIGDIGHTPGVLRLIEQHLPGVDVRLWPSDVGNGVEALLRRRFPALAIVRSPDEVAAAFRECDFLLHGSGPSLVGRADVRRWSEQTGKPFGVYGITFPGVYGTPAEMSRANPVDIELLTKARFAFFRDSVSLAFAREHGVTSPIMEFGPDGAFAVDVRNDEKAQAFLSEHRLEDGRFMCVIPRQRFTPYWEIAGRNTPFNAERQARNDAMKEHDNGPLREAMIAVVRETSMKILVCPEDETQVKFGKAALVDPLPDDVRAKVVWRDRYWLTDEAVSTYVRSAGMFGLEMHSPIMCVGNGVPALVCRFAEQTSKGIMWKDIGLADWLFDMDVDADVRRLVPAVRALATNPGAARAHMVKAREFVETRQRETMATLASHL